MSSPLWPTSFQATAFASLIIGGVIYGAIAQQIARYAFVFRNDTNTLKIWVYALSFLTSAGLVVDAVNTWYYLTSNISTSTSDAILAFNGLLLGVTVALVQIFFTFRIWSARKKIRPGSPFTVPFVIGLGLCIAASWGASIAANIFIAGVVPSSEFELKPFTTVILQFKTAIDAVIDGLVTIFLVTLLRVHRSESSHLHKESPLTMLLVFFATRGLIILVTQIMFFILIFAADPVTVGTANTTIMPKIYAVSMLLTLTNRKTSRGTSGSASSGSRGQHARGSEHVNLRALSFRTNVQPDTHRGAPGEGSASPVMFASSKGPTEEVTMEPDPDDWENSIGDHRRRTEDKVPLPIASAIQ
ncbi:hypothetical protein PENSPDRAFT_119346 [Peniophora sp. CONT]|nr:hypothetical protein PENSPDRAFT_119346 [Peniophora sp. CONT]